MIRRLVEYAILCDAERFGLYCRNGSYHSFGCDVTLAGCATNAKQSGWIQVSKRLWLCPDCAEKYAAKNKEEIP